jgi:hypothetical protein
MISVLFLILCKEGKQAAIDPLDISQHQMLLHQGKPERQKVTLCGPSSIKQREKKSFSLESWQSCFFCGTGNSSGAYRRRVNPLLRDYRYKITIRRVVARHNGPLM